MPLKNMFAFLLLLSTECPFWDSRNPSRASIHGGGSQRGFPQHLRQPQILAWMPNHVHGDHNTVELVRADRATLEGRIA